MRNKMKILNLKTNHLTNPLGYDLGKPVFSFLVTETRAKKQEAAQIQIAGDADFSNILFDSGKSAGIDSLAYTPDIVLNPRTRYWWRAHVWADNGESAVSDAAWFETAKAPGDWRANWIAPPFQKNRPAEFLKSFRLSGKVAKARAYIVGLGLYELSLNGKKVGEEYLTPGCHAYDHWIQYQTYDLTSYLGEENELSVTVADGWYCGRFGLNGRKELYGEQTALIAEIVLQYTDGTEKTVSTDGSWKARKSKITFANIYDGEWYDASFSNQIEYPVQTIDLGHEKLHARLSPPVTAHERLVPARIIQTPAGETVLDMGQNMVGWLEADFNEPAGTEILLQFGEILQDGNFYQENLRSAKEEYKFISDGKPHRVRQHFTFYGFRYVKVSGMTRPVRKENFTGVVLHSQMDRVGRIETSDPLVNRLYRNALWGQKGNFIDVPTDCPQRDERMGWTGDAQAFSGTACYNADTYAFYTKYGRDLAFEQKSLHGAVPFVVPMAGMPEGGSSVWGEAATVIPWNVYLHSGDKRILENQFESMKAWVDYIWEADEADGGRRLWMRGFHFGDWLALDNFAHPDSNFGGTDSFFIASAYYYYSASLVTKAAHVLGKEACENEYGKLAGEIRRAIQNEYFSADGRICIDTQTAYVLALYMDLVPESARPGMIARLMEHLRDNGWKLTTGFVGTPFLCQVLSENGSNDAAYRLLFNREYPGWLYEVLMGATTIWERWNSVLPDGKISGTGMNSLNHYTYGSIVEWMYRYMMGFVPVEEAPGFRKIILSPKPNYRLQWAKASLNTAAGRFESAWRILSPEKLEFDFSIPYNTEADIVLPDAAANDIAAQIDLPARKNGNEVTVHAGPGSYHFSYRPAVPYAPRYHVHMPSKVLMENDFTRAAIYQAVPNLSELTDMAGAPIHPETSEEPFDSLILEKCHAFPLRVLQDLNVRLQTIAVKDGSLID